MSLASGSSDGADWPANRLFIRPDMELRDTSDELNSGLLVATDAKGLIHQGGGHAHSLKENVKNLLEGCHVHAFSTIRSRFVANRPRARFRRMSAFHWVEWFEVGLASDDQVSEGD